jgi:hypothetical protein
MPAVELILESLPLRMTIRKLTCPQRSVRSILDYFQIADHSLSAALDVVGCGFYFTAILQPSTQMRGFYTASLIRIGNLRARFPVAANTAFATAGATGGTGGSPTPIGCSVLATM